MTPVSIVVTCYNYARFLPDAVESALGQTHRDVEVVLIDDGSTDDTPQVAARWFDDARFRYVRQSNAGQSAAKNHGIRLATHPLVAFLDADDRWDLAKLEKQVPLFDRPEVGVVYSRGLFLAADGSTRVPPEPTRHRVPRAGDLTTALLFDNMIPFSSAVVRRDLLEQVAGFDETLAMAIDWDLWLRLSLRCEFDWVDERLMHYRIGHGDQMSRQALVRLDCCEKLLADFLARHGDGIPRSAVRAALAYSYAQRGGVYARHDWRRGLGYYWRSIGMDPLVPSSWVGLARTLARPVLRLRG